MGAPPCGRGLAAGWQGEAGGGSGGGEVLCTYCGVTVPLRELAFDKRARQFVLTMHVRDMLSVVLMSDCVVTALCPHGSPGK